MGWGRMQERLLTGQGGGGDGIREESTYKGLYSVQWGPESSLVVGALKREVSRLLF